jgi:hypothetical protein
MYQDVQEGNLAIFFDFAGELDALIDSVEVISERLDGVEVQACESVIHISVPELWGDLWLF